MSASDESVDKGMALDASKMKRPLRPRALLFLFIVALLYFFYTLNLSRNPPGFYLDESSIAYNAHLMARTGLSEEGVAWPLYVRSYTGVFSVYANPTYIYLLAGVYLFSPPSILAARLLSASLGFAAALALGYLAWRMTGRRMIGVIVALFTMLTPWLFEVSRLVFEVALYPLALALFLLALHRAEARQKGWSWLDCALIAAGLGLLTYTYTIGRLFALLLAFGLLIFARDRRRLVGVLKTWLLFGVTLLPLLVFNRRHPGVLTERFYLISYIKPESTWGQIIPEFISHYFDNLSLWSLLLIGDTNPRHHVAGMGSFLAPVLILALLGIYLVLKYHWQQSWWRFILYGLAVSPISASLTLDHFHTLRMIPYPVFLILLTVPALQRLIEGRAVRTPPSKKKAKKKAKEPEPVTQEPLLSFFSKRKALGALLALALLQALYFQYQFHRDGLNRGAAFDAGYRDLYRQALAEPERPIYLLDGMWGPAYIHAFWYAAMDGRAASDFIHLEYGQRPPAGALVISSEDKCTNCHIILRRDQYLLYRAL